MVVIIGAGIAGAASAYYYLARQSPSAMDTTCRCTLIDAVGPGACSSGTAGAYLSASWGDGTKRERIFRESFQLHEQLAKELELNSFHFVPSFRIQLYDHASVRSTSHPQETVRETSSSSSLQNWRNRVANFEEILGPAAIVDPYERTNALVDHAVKRGANFLRQSVESFDVDMNDDEDENEKFVRSIRFQDNSTLPVAPGEDVVIAMGPWSSRIEDWFDVPLPIDGVSSTSIIWEDPQSSSNLPVIDAALFANEDVNGCHLEILPRSDGSLYVSGCGGSTVSSPAVFRSAQCRPHPQDDCPPNMARATAAYKSMSNLLFGAAHSIHNTSSSSSLSLTPPTDIRACIRPVSPDGVPIVGKLDFIQNVYVVTGGGPWGITWGPVMGKCLAAMLDQNKSLHIYHDDGPPIRLASLSPRRFDTLIYRTFLRQRKSEPN